MSQTENEINDIIGKDLLEIFVSMCRTIKKNYDIAGEWNPICKNWDYELKYRKGGKTLCTFFIKKNCLGFMIIFGAKEREKFESVREEFSLPVQKIYDESKTYHDGKWMMFMPAEIGVLRDFENLLAIKRRPIKGSM